MSAAVLHASWNALVKSSAHKHVSMCAVVFGHVPIAFVLTPFVVMPNPQSWPYILGGAVLHVGYQLLLLTSYRSGDLTQVYPIARGTAPLLVAVVSVLILGVSLSPLELTAVAAIGLGIISLSAVRQGDGSTNRNAALLALLTGCFIAAYSLVDGLGARIAETAIGFYVWLTFINAGLLGAVMFFAQPGTLRRIPTEAPWLFVFGGGASFVAYALVMWAFTQAPIALVTALRETSIVFALLIGVLVLKERLSLAKVLWTFVTLAGAVLLRFSR